MKLQKLFRKKSFRLAIFLMFVIGALYLTGMAFGYGQNNNNDNLVLDITLDAKNYNASTKTFSDKSNQGNNGVSVNNATFAPGQYGDSEGAMSFNGTSDYVYIPNSASLNISDSITVSYWMRPLSIPTGYASHISSKSTPSKVTDATFVDYFYGGNNADTGKLNYIVNRGGSWASASPTSQVLAINSWHFVTWTYDKNIGGRLYINGIEVPGGPVGSGALALNSEPVRLGHFFYGGHSYFNGNIANYKIFNRVLSSREIIELYNDSKPRLQISSIEKGLIAHWPLDGVNYNSVTKRVTDSSAYSNHGTSYNEAVFADGRNDKERGAMSFSNLDDRINISYKNPIYQTSIVAWFKSIGAPRGGFHIITGGPNVEISIPTTGKIRTGVVTDALGRKVYESGSGLVDGNWHQVALTYDGSSLRSFIDGNLTDNNSVTGNLVGTAAEIGRYLGNAYGANGYISDVRVYNRALSGDEIKLLYNIYSQNMGSGPLQKGLILDMPLTSQYTKDNNIVIDNSAYARHGINNLGNINNDSYDIINANGYIEHPTISFDKSESWSFSMWQYKPLGSATQWQAFIGDYMGNNGGYWMFHPGLSWYQDSYDNGTGTKPYGYMYSPVNLGDEIPYNKWYMLTVSYDGSDSNIYIYVNDVLEFTAEATWSPRPVSKASFRTIGQGGGNRYFEGKISNVKIYNRVLTAAEIETLYDQGRGGTGAIMGVK